MVEKINKILSKSRFHGSAIREAIINGELPKNNFLFLCKEKRRFTAFAVILTENSEIIVVEIVRGSSEYMYKNKEEAERMLFRHADDNIETVTLIKEDDRDPYSLLV